jgi:MFS family permease
MLAAPFITIFVRRFGMHVSMCIGLVLQTTGYVTAGFANHVWQLFLSQGVLVGLGVGFIYVPSIPVLSQWFHSRRSLANGLSSAGSGVGGALFTWSTGAIIDTWGLRWALCVTGIITFALISFATLLIRDRNKHIRPSQLAIDTKLLLRRDVLLLLAWTFTSMLGYIALLFSLSDYATAVELSRQQATNVIGFLNIGTAVGRPVIGIVSDKSSRLDVAGVLTLVCGLLCFVFWIPTQSFALLAVFALLAGAVLGVFWMVSIATSSYPDHHDVSLHRWCVCGLADIVSKTIGPLCAELVELKDLQSLLSLSWMTAILPTTCECFTHILNGNCDKTWLLTCPRTVSEVIALEIRRPESSRPYLYPQLLIGVSYLVASGFMFVLRQIHRSRQRGMIV